ncbi:MAG: alcohol dehydrogenase catalytic domain-containing protein [Deltaproteobacteria bacterium]|nr:alcohol dehydrogenase catalytic domain-containing protein [Deltaproteobacteria bacterium]
MTTHRDIVIEKYGPASTLLLRNIAPRAPGPDEVAIDVAYSGVNFADVQMRIGLYPDAPKKPFVPGYEVSGTISAVGKNVKDLKVGERVVAGTYFGGYASSVTIPAHQAFKLPKAYDLAAGAALPVAYFTAQLAVFEMARVRKGDKVLIECATGGVGVLAMQMAKHVGAEVTGLTTTPAKKSFIESHGATAFTLDEFKADSSLRGYDFILNSSGGGNIQWQRKRLGMTGRMVCIGVSSGVKDGKRSFLRIARTLLQMPRISILKLFNDNTGIYALNALHVLRDETWISKLTASMTTVEAMGLAPHVGRVFPASEVGAAHDFLSMKQATGKVLLSWNDAAAN